MVYKWKTGARISVSAQKAGERLEWLRKEVGKPVSRQDVLEDARSSSSPLHKAFEWDDSLAAEQHRLQQAGHILNCLVVVRIKVQHPQEDKPRYITNVRALHSVTQNDERGFETTARIMGVAELREQLLADAAAELERFRLKYRQLKELAEVFIAVDEFRKSLRKVNRRRKRVVRAKRKPRVRARKSETLA